jgi:uncharacterized protein involved in outer membrane biogenesis
MRWTLRILLAIALAVALLGVAIILLFTIDLGRFKSNFQDYVSSVTEREFIIEGRFEPSIGSTIDLVAEDVHLANADWGSAENILELERVVVSIDTWSLLSGPIEVLSLEVEGLTLHVEKEPGTLRSSWSFGDSSAELDDAREPDRPFELPLLRGAQLTDISVTYGQGWLEAPRSISINDASLSEDDRGLLKMALSGTIGDDPIQADGLVGPLPALLDGRDPRWELQISIGEFLTTTQGTFRDLFALEGPEIHAVMQGPRAELVLDRFGLPPLARGPVDITADIFESSEGIELRVEGEFGNLTTDVTGRAQSLHDLEDLDLAVDVRGPDLQAIGRLFGADFLPSAGFWVDGDITITGDTLTMQSFVVSAGDARLELDGKLSPTEVVPDALLRLSASGPEILDFLPPSLIDNIPSSSFDIQAIAGGELRHPELRQLAIDLGENVLSLELADARIDLAGLAQAPLAPDQHYANIAIRGQDMQALLEPWVDVLIPAVPFSINGTLTADDGALQLSNVTYRFDEAHGTLGGTTGQLPSFEGLRFDTTFAGPDASQFIDVLGDPESDIRLPADDFETRGSISKTSAGWVVSPWMLRIGESRLEFNGSLGNIDAGAGIDIDFVSSGPDLRRFIPDRDLDTPAPFHIGGGLKINETTIELQEIDLRIGETTAWLNGRLPTSTEIMNAEFDVRIAGPNLQRIGRVFDVQNLPAEAYRFEGALKRSGDSYAIDNLVAEIGDNDLSGSFGLEIAPRIRLTGRLESTHLDLAGLRGQNDDVAEPDEGAPKPDHLIPDTPLPLQVLDAADVDMSLRLRHLATERHDIGDVEFKIVIEDGKLHVETGEVVLSNGGTLTAALDLARTAPDHANFQASILATQFNFRAAVDADGTPITRPRRDLELSLSGSGSTVRDLAASADGSISLRLGEGDIDNDFSGYFMRDLVSQLFSAINPLAKESKYTRLDCGFFVFDIVDGVARGRAVGLQTDKLSVASLGTLNLATEALNFSFRIKQREGIGISLSGVINPYVKVGGTLASPALQVDTKRGLLTGTVAFLTSGVSILAKGVWDRYLSQDDYCQTVIEALDSGEIPAWEGPATSE